MEDSLQSGSEPVTNNEIRQRISKEAHKPQQAASADDARETVMELNAAQESSGKDEKDRRTFGRTPDGRVFTVPHTEDMVSQLLSPTQPKNISDIIILANLGVLLLALWLLPKPLKQPFFAVAFLFWRACYNGGIGYLLYEQSNYKSLVHWAKKSGIFEHPSTGKNPHPKLYPFLKREMETKIPKDYTFEDAPLEYNTWLLFRRVVDLILMSDFIAYCCFAAACGGTPPGEHIAMTIARWAAGWALVFFNLWVKLDAHRVVKDFAWYWGDFFYLIDQELTFDGVFEMAPHPMYSVGYAGFYGISIMAASYKVLFISIIGHAAQFAFLAWVENPHIEKTYNPPPPRRRMSEPLDIEMTDSQTLDTTFEPTSPTLGATTQQPQPAYVRDLIGIQNVDLHRTVDNSVLLLQFYLFAFALLTPSTGGYQAFFVLNAFAWRLWYSLGIGYILNRQSKKKSWVRHFIKYGESIEESWRQWKGVYHLSMTMCYASFVAAAYKMYTLPNDWQVGMVLLRHVTGAGLVTLHLWVVFSIYESLGEFGWFFGDFFFDKTPKLTYSGIYRFLNNPERVIGIAGLWGLALITWSKSVFLLAFLSHILTLGFLQFVERPHMQKRYGKSLREHSGISKTVSNTLPKSVRTWQGKVDQIVDQTVDSVEDFIDSATPKLTASVDAIVKDTKSILRRYPAKMSITRLGDLDGFDTKDYSIEVIGTPSPSNRAALDKVSKREGLLARRDSFKGKEFQPPNFAFGAPIRVKWTAPLHHGKKDWIGLYMIADNASREVTRISSQGRWIATTEGSFDSYRADQGIIVSNKQVIQWDNDQGKPLMTGEMEFAGDKLWWTTGVFEFRYHHDGKHNVMAISQPFEIRIGKFDESDVSEGPNETLKSAIEKALLPVVQNCFDRDPEIAPSAAEEAYGSLVERDGKFARRVVFAVWQMFGIELAPEVVKADGNVRNLAWRICNAKQVLAPYSMSATDGGADGAGTPTEEKDN